MMDDAVEFETSQFVVIFVFIVGTFGDIYYDIDIAFGLVYESGKVIDEVHCVLFERIKTKVKYRDFKGK
jgi:hypothetical protein